MEAVFLGLENRGTLEESKVLIFEETRRVLKRGVAIRVSHGALVFSNDSLGGEKLHWKGLARPWSYKIQALNIPLCIVQQTAPS
jgi:hypothetical protein